MCISIPKSQLNLVILHREQPVLHAASNFDNDNDSVVSKRGDSLFVLLLFLRHV